ncbi:unnamed protein product [Rotaria socialis]|uniref:Uncharacterized protein n=1 Tax=Rotaria socialis TaxID=392032 RepID=A0A821LFX6_9BILA|nr:unnamed protein product [Rotaria socialis]
MYKIDPSVNVEEEDTADDEDNLSSVSTSGKTHFHGMKTACWLLTDEKASLSADRVKRVQQGNYYMEYIYRNQRLIFPVVWRCYGRWRRFKQFITCSCTRGRIVFYKTGILIDELFVVILRPNGLIFSQAELVDINEQTMLRLHFLAVQKEKQNSPMHAPCHVDILVPRVIQESKKRLELVVEYLNHILSKTSADDDEISNKVLKHRGKISRIIEV